MKTISFCIVCMNRLHQLKETLLVNIELYLNRPGIDFVILNYNSKDGMEDWVKECLSVHIKSGFLKYFMTPEPENFSHSHSKNMVFSLAQGDILCSINADHYIGSEFDNYLRAKFKKSPKSFVSPYITPDSKQKYIPPRDVVGKICINRADFIATGGYDERFKNYGFEDIDFVNRLERHGLKKITLNKQKFLQYIEHGDDERIKLKVTSFFGVYVNYISPSLSEVIYLHDNGMYDKVTYVRVGVLNSSNYIYAYKERNFIYNFEILNDVWEYGQWKLNEQNNSIDTKKNGCYQILDDKTILHNSSKLRFNKIDNKDNLINLNAMRSFMRNLSFMNSNNRKKTVSVNNLNYGQGIVFKNFDNEKFEFKKN